MTATTIIAHHLGHFLLGRSKVQVHPTLKEKELCMDNVVIGGHLRILSLSYDLSSYLFVWFNLFMLVSLQRLS